MDNAHDQSIHRAADRDTAAHAEPTAAPPREAAFGRSLDDVPLRSKVRLIVLLAASGGALVGIVGPQLEPHGLTVVVGLSLLLAAMLWLGDGWIWRPMDRLLRQLDQVRLREQPAVIEALPTSRHDEIGRIARVAYELALQSLRNQFEARNVRRTLDSRVRHATRQATQRLYRMSMHDPLTDLANRRFLEDNLEPLVARARANREDLIAVAIDVDNFKQVNDTLGHDAGDDLLIGLVAILRGCLRRTDYAVRLGGDEFVLLLPGCTLDQAAAVTGRIAELFRQFVRNRVPAALGAGLSLGVASLLRDRPEDGGSLLKKADQMLYDAKHGGKARIAGA